MNRAKAIGHIRKHGILVIFPVQNKKEPQSLWSCFFPKTAMRWEWDDGGDSRVADLWHLREELSRSGKVVYAKWYKNRATVFSPDCFRWTLSILRNRASARRFSSDTQKVLSVIADNSPLSTKELKKTLRQQYGLAGNGLERCLKELWQPLAIVGFGEVDDGAFPSLAVGTSDQLFESWCQEAEDLDPVDSRAKLEKTLGKESVFLKELDRVLKNLGEMPLPKTKKKRGSVSRVLRYEDLVGR